MNQPAVYILASRRNGTLYVVVTSNLRQRVWEYKSDLHEGFTKRYQVHSLVYYGLYGSMQEAITREKQLKKWNRAWKPAFAGMTVGKLSGAWMRMPRMRGDDRA